MIRQEMSRITPSYTPMTTTPTVTPSQTSRSGVETTGSNSSSGGINLLTGLLITGATIFVAYQVLKVVSDSTQNRRKNCY